MKYTWGKMTNKQRNELINRYILKFKCFETPEGIAWYEKHYDMGFWHYLTNIKNVMEIVKRIAKEQDLIVIIKMVSDVNLCCITTKYTTDSSLPFLKGATINEAICLALLRYFCIEVNYEDYYYTTNN